MLRRPLWTIALALPLAALALWGSSRLGWSSEVRQTPGTGVSTTVTRTGADFAPLVPLALLALAGLAAALAMGGWPRRVLGAVLGLGGLTAACYAVIPLADFVTFGRVLALAGGVMLMTAGIVLVLRSDRLPRMGSRYQARDPDNVDGDLWLALSQGKDPTTEEHHR
ncbi:MAG TPA: Trp biosynthesis-associated membrane protein [Actinophytocola sp.]|uniref:Trp biosynthesis-associated membrane protein n=1 Tax=Actinophytocola sp. TaxID=1872138 RepID=UPI002DBAF23C|nr:Trp biosynthesis-associated membrane protein [Actinophytocola sp.]HEU5474548.1 Trp biosynthesis-associated membrane protein [Actinophytocola sp.]